MKSSRRVWDFHLLSQVLLSIAVVFAIVAWALNPYACCPRECQRGMLSASETMCPMNNMPCISEIMCISENTGFQNADVFSNGPAAKTTVARMQLVKADSQLGKTAIPASPIQHSLVNPHSTVVLWTNNWQIISSGEQTEPHSAFLSRIKHPPKL